MASNTENLGLYMADPTADAADYFDIDKLLNDNWKKVDGKAALAPILATSPPTEETKGVVGQLYLDTVSEKQYQCVSDIEGVYEWFNITLDSSIGLSPDVATALGLSGNPQVKDAILTLNDKTFKGVEKKVIVNNTTFVAPYTGKYFVEIWGGGGGAANVAYMQVGGGAGYAAKTIQLSKGQSVPITVGRAGSMGYWSNTEQREIPGTNGTATSFGSIITASGGSYGGGVGNGNGGDINFSGYQNLSYLNIAGVRGYGYGGSVTNGQGGHGVCIITLLDKEE